MLASSLGFIIGLMVQLADGNLSAAWHTGEGFSHMELFTVDNQEFLAVAQKNRLLSFSTDLRQSAAASIGPLNDSQSCMPHQVHKNMPSCGVKPTDNHVRAMAIGPGGTRLYVCMSYLSGSCASAPLRPPSSGSLRLDLPAVAAKLKNSVRGLLCPSPDKSILLTVAQRHTSSRGSVSNGLYLSMPFCVSKVVDKIEPTLTVVDPATLQPFTVADSSMGGLSNFLAEVVPPMEKVRAGKLVYQLSFQRFSSTGNNCSCVYFVLTAPADSRGRPEDTRIRVGRLCSTDLYLSRYAEIFIDCGGAEADKEALSFAGEAATVAKPGKRLASTLGIQPNESVLFLAASARPRQTSSPTAAGAKARRGVCAVPLADADRQLDAVLADCRRGEAFYGPTYLRDVRRCPVDASPRDSDGACGRGSEWPLQNWEGAFSQEPRRALRPAFLTLLTADDDDKEGNHRVTALAAVPVARGDTVLYAGTAGGRLYGLRLGATAAAVDVTEGQRRRRLLPLPSPVLAVLAGRDRVFALTAGLVSSHPYGNCERRSISCGACLADGNPHCVWSNLPGPKGGCQTWLPSQSVEPMAEAALTYVTQAANCLQVSAVRNNEIDADRSFPGRVEVSLVARNVPRLAGMRCVLVDDTGAVRDESQAALTAGNSSRAIDSEVLIGCPLAAQEMKEHLGNETSRRLRLFLTTGSSALASASHLASVDVVAFSCRSRPTCGGCLVSSGQCRWCSFDGVCVARDGVCGAGVDSPDAADEASSCPNVRPTSGADEAPMAPAGLNQGRRMVYRVSGLQDYMRHFYCTVQCPGQPSPVEFPASLQSKQQQLACNTTGHPPLDYASEAPNVTCGVAFHWSASASQTAEGGAQRRRLDATDGADSLVLYKCQAMASSCDRCVLATPAQLGCVWCRGACSASCPAAVPAIGHGGLCANPRLSSVQPVKLAPLPNLLVRATGSNLGNRPESLSVRLVPSSESATVLVCRLVEGSYSPGRGFDCRVAAAPSAAAGPYRLEVTLVGLRAGSAAAAATSDDLGVHSPMLESVEAATVQQHGRATVQLLGRHLDAGSDLRLLWRRPCGGGDNASATAMLDSELVERSAESVTVRLGSFPATGQYCLSVRLQGYPVLGSVVASNATRLSVVANARPSVPQSDIRVGIIPSGGLAFAALVDGLRSVQRAVMRFVELTPNNSTNSTAPQALETPCRLYPSSRRLECPSPAVQQLRGHPRGRQRRLSRQAAVRARTFAATIELDALEHAYPSELTLQPDPRLERLPSGLTMRLSEADTAVAAGGAVRRELRLLGRHLLPAVLPADIRVSVGAAQCRTRNIRSTPDQAEEVVACDFALAGVNLGRALQVRATIGWLEFDLGHVTYAAEFPWIYAYIGGGVGSALLAAALVAACIHAHQRSRRRRDKSSGIEMQLNNLEAKVSKTCREAFAELQLNSSPDAGGVSDGGRDLDDPALAGGALPPVRSFEQFVSFSCFAERYRDRFQSNDLIFADVATEEAANGQDSPEMRKALEQLRNLLLNDDFLLATIAALESRPDRFQHQERNHFGSLASALLVSDPAYFTRILTALIRGLIARKEAAQENCKVAFRRCDSVAERLLPNWLAALTYHHLAERVAQPLYRLHREVRLQIYRGPVDQVTEDSRYTINEQKLLKKEIPFKALTLSFQDRLRIFCGEEQLQCKVSVLDCDTVQQAKEKILDTVYSRLGAPASQRVAPARFDLVRVAADTDRSRPLNEGFLVLPEVDDSDGANGLHRLRRIGSCLDVDCGGGPGNFWVYLRPRKPAGSSIESNRRGGGLSKGASYADIGSLPSGVSSKSLQDMKNFSSSYSRIGVSAPRQYHLLAPADAAPYHHHHHHHHHHATLDKSTNKRRRLAKAEQKQQLDDQQIVSELLYPILLSTKKNLVDKITDLFWALFPTAPEQPQAPDCLAYLFGLIDDLASAGHGSPDVAHVWKSNALMLRFYTHHLLNVDYLLDVDVPGPVRYCMTAVSTLFMDACSVERPRKPDKTSTAQRLLFYGEMTELHARVAAFYANVGQVPPPAAVALSDDCQQLSPPPRPFNTGPLLKELFSGFVFKYYDDIVRQLQQHQPCVSDSLISSLQSVMLCLGNESPTLQLHQYQTYQPPNTGSRDRKKRSNSRPTLDSSNAYDF